MHEFYGPIEYNFASALGQMVWSAMRVESLAARTCQVLHPELSADVEIRTAIAEVTRMLNGTSSIVDVDAALWLYEAAKALWARDAIVHASVTSSMAANGNTVAAYYFRGPAGESTAAATDDSFTALTVDALEGLRDEFDELARRWTHIDGSLRARMVTELVLPEQDTTKSTG